MAKKKYKEDVDQLIEKYVKRLDNNSQGKKVLTKNNETLKLLHESGDYPYAKAMSDKAYEKEMEKLQIELVKSQYYLLKSGVKTLLLFEGRDAAGKGGTIQRFMMNINPRHARISALNVPTEYERGQWYFQRYVKNLPSAGEMVFSDRSWYNRAGVEHVMGYCTDEQYQTFMEQVTDFESMLVDSGIILIKYWLSINQLEQLRRFRKRQTSELRRWKLSPNDIDSIDKWDDYSKALEAIFKRTSHKKAPWHMVHFDDKKRGRIECIRHYLSHIDYPDKDEELINKMDKSICYRVS